jgi:hypothetical protein
VLFVSFVVEKQLEGDALVARCVKEAKENNQPWRKYGD